MAAEMEIKTTEDLVFRAISEIRKNSKRPDKESIVLHLTTNKGIGLVTELVLNTVDKLIANQNIIIKKHKGNDSFYVSKDSLDHGQAEAEDSDAIEELTSSKLKSQDCDHKQNGNDARVTSKEKFDESAITGLAGSLGKMADAINNLNSLLENERLKSSNLLMENFSLVNKNRDLKLKIENMLLSQNNPEQRDSIRTIAIRSELISTAQRHNNDNNERVLSKEQPTSDNETKAGAKDKATATKADTMNKRKDGSVNKTAQNINNAKDKNKTKLQANKSRNPETGGARKRDKSSTGKKLKVLVVGDSQLRHVNGEKLENDHRDVEVRFKPGMKIEEAKKKADTSDEFDVIIVHAGTNNLRDNSPSDLAEVIVNTMETVQKKNPSARVAYSSIFKRKDDQTLNAKARKVNELLSEELSIRGMDFMNNDNIIYSNLWKDGLHLNDGGVRKFSGNLSKFIKYC